MVCMYLGNNQSDRLKSQSPTLYGVWLENMCTREVDLIIAVLDTPLSCTIIHLLHYFQLNSYPKSLDKFQGGVSREVYLSTVV